MWRLQKRIVPYLAAVLLGCTLCACAGALSNAPAQVKTPERFEATAHTTYKGMQASMRVCRRPAEGAQVTYESPPNMSGMTLSFYPDRTMLFFQGLEFTVAPGDLPGQAAVKLFFNAVTDSIENQEIRMRQADGKLYLEGRLDEGAYALVLDSATGNILKFSIPQSQLEMELLDFKILE